MADMKKKFNFDGIREKARAARDGQAFDVEQMYKNSFSWQAISEITDTQNSGAPRRILPDSGFNFSGKVLRGGKYNGENLKGASFSGSDLKETDFSKADLEGADFTGADLSGADLSGANLNGAVFSAAKLRGTNFTGAKMNGVVLAEADIQDAILLNIEMDRLAIEELQALVEYLAVYYPHKLNLTRMNLTLLDFSKIDLRYVNLRGVDFTGVNFTGVNIFELDLSECVISVEQIAQALGRMPTPKELKQILAPKKKRSRLRGIDFSPLFNGRGSAGTLDLTKHPGITVEQLLKSSKQIYRAIAGKPEPKDEEIMEQFHKVTEEKQDNLAKEHNAEMRRVIEARKREVREMRMEEQKDEKTVDLTDYEGYEQAKRREKEEQLRQAKEKFLQNTKSENNRSASMMKTVQMMRSRGERTRG